jgi:UDP-N-acetyl-D-mannosaminuronate dehydrogenase
VFPGTHQCFLLNTRLLSASTDFFVVVVSIILKNTKTLPINSVLKRRQFLDGGRLVIERSLLPGSYVKLCLVVLEVLPSLHVATDYLLL